MKLMNIDVEFDNDDSDGGDDGIDFRKRGWGQSWGLNGSDFVLLAPLVRFQPSFPLLKPASLVLKEDSPKVIQALPQLQLPTPTLPCIKCDGSPYGQCAFLGGHPLTITAPYIGDGDESYWYLPPIALQARKLAERQALLCYWGGFPSASCKIQKSTKWKFNWFANIICKTFLNIFGRISNSCLPIVGGMWAPSGKAGLALLQTRWVFGQIKGRG